MATGPDSADVTRMLGLESPTPAETAAINKAIESAKSWAKKYLRYDYESSAAAGTEAFYDVTEDGSVPIPVKGALVTKVTVFITPQDPGTDLDEDQFTWTNTEVRLRPTLHSLGYEGETVRRQPRTLTKIVVTYDASGLSIPAGIRDGVALAAAAIFARSGRVSQGYGGENIGDYSYSIGGGSGSAEHHPLYQEAKWVLRPYRRAPRLVAGG